MSTQSHRSVIKEQLAPFWVYMWCLGNKLLPAMVPSFPLLSKRFGAAKRAYPSFRIPQNIDSCLKKVRLNSI